MNTFKLHVMNITEEDAKVVEMCMENMGYDYDSFEASTEIVIDELECGMELIYEPASLAACIAEKLPESRILITGCIECHASPDCRDYIIEYKNQKLTSKYSAWYICLDSFDWDCYEDFANDFSDEDGNPLFDEEYFEKFLEKEVAYIMMDDNGDYHNENLVLEVPLDFEEEFKEGFSAGRELEFEWDETLYEE